MLRALHPPDVVNVASREVNVVVVPGVGTASPGDWNNSSGRWLEKLVQDCRTPLQVWTYQHKIETKSGSVIHKVAEEGVNLLNALDELCNADETKRKPLFFICHSLGGVILKRALSLTRDHMFKYLNVVEVISGIVFLGTPHLPLNINPKPNFIESILRLQQKTIPRKDNLRSDDNLIIAQFCRSFELMGVQVPIVSAYEKMESSIYEGMFAKLRKPRQMVIVPQDHGVIGSKNEEIVGVQIDHKGICIVEVGGEFYKKLQTSLEGAVSDARSLISEKFNDSSRDWREINERRSQTTEDVRSQSTPALNLPGLSIEQGDRGPSYGQGAVDSNDATYGSSLPRSQLSGNPLTDFEPLRRQPRLPCFSMKLHKENDDFHGREDILALIDESLLPTTQSTDVSDRSLVRSFALCGMGGVGKTEIAVKYAYSRRSKFDAIFWVTADDKNILTEEFARIAVDLGLRDDNEIQDLTMARELVKGWLTNPVRSYNNPSSVSNEVSWLLIFDNADKYDVLEDFWPTTGLGAVLTTSRDPLAKNQTHAANWGKDIQPLSDPEAMKFMSSLTRKFLPPGKPNHDNDLAETVSKLGGLPLLITQMAGVMARLRLSYSDFLTLCNESGIEHVNQSGISGKSPATPYTISSKIGLDGLSQKSLGLLYLISMLDPDRIPESVLTGACSNISAIDFPKTRTEYFEARAQLLQSSLISQNPDTQDIWVHRIVQYVAKERLDQAHVVKVYEAAVYAVSVAWPFARLESRFNTNRYRDCAALFPNVIRLKNGYGGTASLDEFKHDLPTAKLFSDAGWYWFERGFQEESREWFDLVQTICEQLEDKSSDDVAYIVRETHHNQGTAAGETNDREHFLNHSSIWLDMMLKRQDENGKPVLDYELGIGYNEVGNAYAMNGKYQVATEYFVKSIETFQALPNYEDTMLGWPESNIGLMYWMLGNHDDAERALTEIIEIYKTAYGVDDTQSFKTGKMLYALGNVYVSQGRFAEGFEMHTRCLKQYRATLGDLHHRIGDACHRLADDNLRFKDFSEAQKLINQALKVFSGRPRYRNELARSTYKAAQLSKEMGLDDKAAQEFQEAFSIRQKLVPKDKRHMEDLKEADYDELVVFWSR